MNISRRGDAQPARQLRREIARDIAEKIAGDDHAKLAGIAHQFGGQRIDIKMARLDFWIFAAHLGKNALPEFMAKGERVRFVAHQHFAQLTRAGVFKGVADDALDAAARVDVFLNGDLFWIAAPELAARARVESFCVLAENDEANIVFAAIAQRRERAIEQIHGPCVNVEIKLGPQPEKNIGGGTNRKTA